jgi:hypothetical protein
VRRWESVHTLALAAALVLDLVPREVRIILLKLGLFPESAIDASNPRSKQLAKTPLDTRGRGVAHHDAGRGNAARIQNTLTVGILAILLGELEDGCWRKVRGGGGILGVIFRLVRALWALACDQVATAAATEGG